MDPLFFHTRCAAAHIHERITSFEGGFIITKRFEFFQKYYKHKVDIFILRTMFTFLCLSQWHLHVALAENITQYAHWWLVQLPKRLKWGYSSTFELKWWVIFGTFFLVEILAISYQWCIFSPKRLLYIMTNVGGWLGTPRRKRKKVTMLECWLFVVVETHTSKF